MSKHITRLRRRPSALDLVRQGDGFRKSGDFPHAEEAYRKAVRIDPRFDDAWAELGCLMMDCRSFAESAACFRQLLGRGGEAEADEPAQAAVKLLLGVVSLRPDWARGQFSLGCAYEHLGDRERARGHLRHALRLDPSRQAAVQALFARMYWFEGKWKDRSRRPRFGSESQILPGAHCPQQVLLGAGGHSGKRPKHASGPRNCAAS